MLQCTFFFADDDRQKEVESSIPSVVVKDETYEEKLGKELEKTLLVHQLPVPAAGEKVEIPDSQEATLMERTNMGRSQLWGL